VDYHPEGKAAWYFLAGFTLCLLGNDNLFVYTRAKEVSLQKTILASATSELP